MFKQLHYSEMTIRYKSFNKKQTSRKKNKVSHCEDGTVQLSESNPVRH